MIFWTGVTKLIVIMMKNVNDSNITKVSVSILSVYEMKRWKLFGLGIFIFAGLILSSEVQAQDADRKQMLEQMTSIRTVGVADFTVDGNSIRVEPQHLAQLSKLVAEGLSFSTYLKAQTIDVALGLNESRQTLVQTAQRTSNDGILSGQAKRIGKTLVLELQLYSGMNGYRLDRYTVPLTTSLRSEGSRRQLAEAVVLEMARGFPYRGFATQVLDGKIEVNLGEAHGVVPGSRLRFYEFTEPQNGFKSDRRWVGDAKVVELKGEALSVAEPIGSESKIERYHKVALPDQKMAMAMATPAVDSRGVGYIGAELVTIDVESVAPEYADRIFQMTSAPGFSIGLNVKNWELDLMFAQARNDNVDVAYAESKLAKQAYDGYYNGFQLRGLLGGRVAHYNVTTRRTIQNRVPTTTVISPLVEGQADYMIGAGVRLLSALYFIYPVLSTGQKFETTFYNIGGGARLGIAVDITPIVGLEMGARLKYLRRPVEDLSAVQERLTSFYGGLTARF